ncbi:MAG: hypothetical protein ABIH72_02170 [archaeon]
MRKRGVSTLIVMVFLILLAAIFSLIMALVIQKFSVHDDSTQFSCLQDMDVAILDACYENNILKVDVKNNKNVLLGDFLLILINFGAGETSKAPTIPGTTIRGFESKTAYVIFQEPITEPIKEIYVVPRLQQEKILCYEGAPKYSNIKQCI